MRTFIRNWWAMWTWGGRVGLALAVLTMALLAFSIFGLIMSLTG